MVGLLLKQFMSIFEPSDSQPYLLTRYSMISANFTPCRGLFGCFSVGLSLFFIRKIWRFILQNSNCRTLSRLIKVCRWYQHRHRDERCSSFLFSFPHWWTMNPFLRHSGIKNSLWILRCFSSLFRLKQLYSSFLPNRWKNRFWYFFWPDFRSNKSGWNLYCKIRCKSDRKNQFCHEFQAWIRWEEWNILRNGLICCTIGLPTG